ncbi:MAG: hypothetical protein AB1567_11160 [bacterium]
MTWLQILAQGAIIATFLGVGIAVSAYFNGKHIKEGVRETREMISDIGKMIGDIGKLIKEGHDNIGKMIEEGQRETRELIEKIDSRAEERHRELLQALKLI